MAATRCRIGLVGAGAAGTAHATMLAGFHDVTVAGVADPDVAAAARLAGAVGASVAADIPALLSLGLNAVYICVPADAHGGYEDAILDAGLSFFVEPPLGVDTLLPDRLAMRVATAGVVATVGHPWRYSVAVQRAAEALAGRTVRLVNGVCLDSTRTVHVVDVIRRLAGEVVGVSAVATGRTAAATLKFGSGAVGTFTTTDQPGRGGRVALEIYADGVRIVVSDTGSELHFEDRIERHTANPAAAHEALDRAFIAAVQRPKTSNGLLVEYADGVRSHRLAIALTRAAAAGYPVRLA